MFQKILHIKCLKINFRIDSSSSFTFKHLLKDDTLKSLYLFLPGINKKKMGDIDFTFFFSILNELVNELVNFVSNLTAKGEVFVNCVFHLIDKNNLTEQLPKLSN